MRASYELNGMEDCTRKHLPRAIDETDHGAKNLHHDRVVVLPIILKHVLELVRLLTLS